MNKCKKCGGDIHYVGFSSVECGTVGCPNYSAVPEPIETIKGQTLPYLIPTIVKGEFPPDLPDYIPLGPDAFGSISEDIDSITAKEIKALIDTDPVKYDYYGLTVISVGGSDYAVGMDAQAEGATIMCIKETVWAFNSSFLERHISALTAEQIDTIRGDSCEDCNDAMLALLDNFSNLTRDAILEDGRGCFLSHYDGEERQIGEYFLYRVS